MTLRVNTMEVDIAQCSESPDSPEYQDRREFEPLLPARSESSPGAPTSLSYRERLLQAAVPNFTAVGIPAALRRFGVLRCYGNVRPDRLPAVLRDKSPNPAMWRQIDGSWMRR